MGGEQHLHCFVFKLFGSSFQTFDWMSGPYYSLFLQGLLIAASLKAIDHS